MGDREMPRVARLPAFELMTMGLKSDEDDKADDDDE
jgi:hypothetical protein